MKRLSLVLASLALGGCMIPLGVVTPNGDKPAVPTPPPIAPVVAGVPVGGPGAGGSTVLRAKQSSVELGLGEDRPLGALVVDGNGLVQTTGVVWVSTNPAVLTVNPTSGEAKALAAGTAIVVATSQANPAAQAQIEVKVTEKQLVKQIVVDPATLRLEDGAKQTLSAQVYMADGTINGNVTWASSDDTIATVSASGEVRARKEGKVTIEAIYALDPRFKGIAVLTVGNPPATTTTTPATGGTVTPGTAPGEEIVPAAPKGKWVFQSSGVTQLAAVDFVDGQAGWAGGGAGMIKTADGGATWTKVEGPTDVRDMKFFDADRGVVLGDYRVHRTTDGGATWTETVLPNVGGFAPALRLAFLDDQEGYLLFQDNTNTHDLGSPYMHTTDGGATWEKGNLPLDNFQATHLLKAGDAKVMLGSGGIYRFSAEDGGWSKVQEFSGGHGQGGLLHAALADSGDALWAYSENEIMKSTTGGATWNALGAPLGGAQPYHITVPRAFAWGDAAHGLVVPALGPLTTGDGGKSWQAWPELAGAWNTSTWTGGDYPTAKSAWIVASDGRIARYIAP